MKTLRNLNVVGGLFQGNTSDEASIGDSIILYLDTAANSSFPVSVTGVIKALALVECGDVVSYSVEYDETVLGLLTLRPHNVIDYLVGTNTNAYIAADVVVTNALTVETAARIAGDTAEINARIAGDAGKAAAVHGHVITDVSGLATDLAGKAPTTHTHDDRYYTETEADALLGGKAPSRQIMLVGFTAVVGGRYMIRNTGAVISVVDPAGTGGQSYSLVVGTGTFRFNGAGDTHLPSRLQIIRYHNGTAWITLPCMVTNKLQFTNGIFTTTLQSDPSGNQLVLIPDRPNMLVTVALTNNTLGLPDSVFPEMEKVLPVSADTIVINDSAEAGLTKSLSFANLRIWIFAILGIPTYPNLTDANLALTIGQPYYDTALAKLQITTA